MNRSIFTVIVGISTAALMLSVPKFVLPTYAQESAPAVSTATAPTPNQLSLLEFQMRSQAPDTADYGRATGEYWKIIATTQDFPRAYNFFAALSDEAKSPNATLLASKASAAGGYLSWLYQNHLADQAGEENMRNLMDSSIAEYKQALALDPDNFSALYGYAVFEGYRPDGQAHQKELLARLETLRASKPYLPWAMVEHLEKTGRPE